MGKKEKRKMKKLNVKGFNNVTKEESIEFADTLAVMFEKAAKGEDVDFSSIEKNLDDGTDERYDSFIGELLGNSDLDEDGDDTDAGEIYPRFMTTIKTDQKDIKNSLVYDNGVSNKNDDMYSSPATFEDWLLSKGNLFRDPLVYDESHNILDIRSAFKHAESIDISKEIYTVISRYSDTFNDSHLVSDEIDGFKMTMKLRDLHDKMEIAILSRITPSCIMSAEDFIRRIISTRKIIKDGMFVSMASVENDDGNEVKFFRINLFNKKNYYKNFENFVKRSCELEIPYTISEILYDRINSPGFAWGWEDLDLNTDPNSSDNQAITNYVVDAITMYGTEVDCGSSDESLITDYMNNMIRCHVFYSDSDIYQAIDELYDFYSQFKGWDDEDDDDSDVKLDENYSNEPLESEDVSDHIDMEGSDDEIDSGEYEDDEEIDPIYSDETFGTQLGEVLQNVTCEEEDSISEESEVEIEDIDESNDLIFTPRFEKKGTR